MSSKSMQEGDTMPIIIEQIIRYEHAGTDAFIKKQQKRLKQLQDMQRRKSEGKKIRVNKIIKELQEAGILDERGELATPYNESV